MVSLLILRLLLVRVIGQASPSSRLLLEHQLLFYEVAAALAGARRAHVLVVQYLFALQGGENSFTALLSGFIGALEEPGVLCCGRWSDSFGLLAHVSTLEHELGCIGERAHQV